MIAVCLLTADRWAYTARTLQTFTRFNAGRDFLKLHADDGSATRHNLEIAQAYGFRTVWKPPGRRGQGEALTRMWWQAASMGADQILHLENDWEWVAPVPADEFCANAPCVRLYGATKARDEAMLARALTGTRDLATGLEVAWEPAAEGWERAMGIHWGGPPSVTDADALLAAVVGAPRIKDVSNRLSLPTLRPLANLVWHIGEEPTPNRWAP